jgi:putative DNA primase/helicase
MLVDYEQILRHLLLLHQPGETIEVRYRYRKEDGAEPSWGKRFQSHEEAAKYAAKVSKRSNTIAVWTNLNRINPEAKIEKLVKDEHIIRRVHILMDFDPIRPDDSNSTEEELKAAIAVAIKAAWYLHDKGVPGFIFLISGNGAQLVAVIDEPPEGNIVERVLKGLNNQFKTDRVKVDCRVTNAGRVTKLAGTAARKGPHSDERPHRMAKIVKVLGELIPTSTEILESLALPESELQQKHQASDALPILDKFDLQTWLSANDVPFTHKTKEDGTDVYEVPCPWKPHSRTTGGAVVFQDPEGSIQFFCHHDSCEGRTWKDYRRKIDPHFRERGRLPTKKTVKDAEYQARRFLETLPPAYLYRSEVWLYINGIWQQPDIEDLRNMVCKSLMRVFGQYADWLRHRKSKAVVPSVTESFITNVLRCLKSILPEIPRQWEMPCWIDGKEAKVLVIENGVLDLNTYQLSKHTPKLFARFKLPYRFDKDAKCPKFEAALKLIFDDVAEILLLQEQYGATLVGGNQRRAVWLWQGATHGGKGILTKTLCSLLGKENYVSIRAASFGGQFALWNARGKLLIVVPDINGKRPLPGAFVEATKIISGGDSIDIDGKNKQGVHESLPAKILLVTNDILRMDDDSAALFNRFKCLKYVHHFFPVGHRLHEPSRPQNEKLEAELADELPGILNWALEGLRRVDANGFTAPKASVALQETLEAEGSPILTYALERLVKDATESEFVGEVYKDYCGWCAEQNIEEPFKPGHFGTALKAAVPTIVHRRDPGGDRKYRYYGIRRKTETELATSA